MPPARGQGRLGYIPDRPFVYDKLTGGEFLRFAAALYGHRGRPSSAASTSCSSSSS